MVFIKLTSDNYLNDLLTPEAYEVVALSMSTGDYATHKTETIILLESDERAQAALLMSEDIIESVY